jgi:hypothetical protein
VSKLVLHLADGTTLDIRLAKERTTIGRRPDNDVCLPHPAISAEHAAVVTILADSFLEDLGSTNGTYVNGKAITKHFLRDRDAIDIGRQRLLYLEDDAARVEPGLPPAQRLSGSLLPEERFDARPPRRLAEPAAGAGADAPGTRPDRGHAERTERQPHERRSDDPTIRGGQVDTTQLPLAAQQRAAKRGLADAFSSPEVPAEPLPEVRVLSGPNAGRAITLAKDEVSVGRVGVQVALIRRADEGYRLIPVEGAQPPRRNGAPIPADGATLAIGDIFEVAGVELQLAMPTGLPAAR